MTWGNYVILGINIEPAITLNVLQESITSTISFLEPRQIEKYTEGQRVSTTARIWQVWAFQQNGKKAFESVSQEPNVQIPNASTSCKWKKAWWNSRKQSEE